MARTAITAMLEMEPSEADLAAIEAGNDSMPLMYDDSEYENLIRGLDTQHRDNPADRFGW